MSVDIIEIALDSYTDYKDFEKLSAEIMHLEGYPNIMPLGGVHDKGKDAKEEKIFVNEGRTITVFQFTTEENTLGKIKSTIEKLDREEIEYHSLVFVTSRNISTESHDKYIKDIRSDFDVELKIYDRKIILNRLADYSNGIFHRYFPDIRKQVEDILIHKQLLFDNYSNNLQKSLLRSSLVFTFSSTADSTRKSIFDYLLLAIIINSEKSLCQLKK